MSDEKTKVIIDPSIMVSGKYRNGLWPPLPEEIYSAFLEFKEIITFYDGSKSIPQLAKDKRFISTKAIHSKYEELSVIDKIYFDSLLFLLTQSKIISRPKKALKNLLTGLKKLGQL